MALKIKGAALSRDEFEVLMKNREHRVDTVLEPVQTRG